MQHHPALVTTPHQVSGTVVEIWGKDIINDTGRQKQ